MFTINIKSFWYSYQHGCCRETTYLVNKRHHLLLRLQVHVQAQAHLPALHVNSRGSAQQSVSSHHIFHPSNPISLRAFFGASNIDKLLNELPPRQREDAASSLAYEAEARVKDPVYDCVGAISPLQGQVQQLQRDLEEARADLARYIAMEMGMQGIHGVPVHHSSHRLLELRRERVLELARLQRSGGPCSEALGVAAAAGIYNITTSSPCLPTHPTSPYSPSLPTHPPPTCTPTHTRWREFIRWGVYI